jgi:alkaline phosphatase/alkaline phosphatase D
MKNHKYYFLLVCFFFLYACNNIKPTIKRGDDIFALPLLAGEVTQASAILQSRLTAKDTIKYGDVHNPNSIANTDLAGKEGYAFFELSQNRSFQEGDKTRWLQAEEKGDFIVKSRIDGLEEGTVYYYRLHFGKDKENTRISEVNSFKTLPGKEEKASTEFIMVTGSHLDRFYLGGGFGKPSVQGTEAYRGEDKYSGFPGFKTIAEMKPDFFIGNGDNVYYDHPPSNKAKGKVAMRAKWHRQFAMPNIRQMFRHVPTYWLKDDHDHRFDDSDTLAVNEKHGTLPSHELGLEIFLEQVPVVDPKDQESKTYRTYRIGKALQVWMVEGRDYRSPNNLLDGPGKSLWGEEQKKWLKQTLLASDADFKILVSPTPMVGPDDASKTDNHINPKGFRYEGDEFFDWLQKNGFSKNNFFIICGDRHWQYHSIHPSGFEEFSCGALVDQNARLGRNPGDPKSTDPEGLIKQPYTQEKASGGFLKVGVNYSNKAKGASLNFVFYDEYGEELYSTTKERKTNK